MDFVVIYTTFLSIYIFKKKIKMHFNIIIKIMCMTFFEFLESLSKSLNIFKNTEKYLENFFSNYRFLKKY